MVDPKKSSGDIEKMFEAVTAMLGRVPNSYSVLARVPLVSKLLLPFNAVMQREGAGSQLTTKIKEMGAKGAANMVRDGNSLEGTPSSSERGDKPNRDNEFVHKDYKSNPKIMNNLEKTAAGE